MIESLILRYAPHEAIKEITNIEYIPATSQDVDKFNDFLNKDLGALGLSRSGSLSDRRARLLDVLKTCEHFKDSRDGFEAAKYLGAMILVRQAVPCILHLENRCGEKILKTLLIERIQQSSKSNSDEEELIKKVEEVINTRILGEERRHTNWRIPVSKNDSSKRVVNDITMPNQHVRKILKEFHLITAVLFDITIDKERERKEKWDNCRTLWGALIEVARKKEDFTDVEIDHFQDQCDNFTEAWLHLLPGDTGMTNYFHVVAAGHLTYYLREWRNLYRYSQQGWEGMNSVIKSLLHKRSQRGGHGGIIGEMNSKAEPIARWALRRMFFLSGDYKTKVQYLKQLLNF